MHNTEIILLVTFFGSLFVLLHCYFIYPFSLLTLSKFFKKNYKRDANYTPSITVIIAAFNEEKVIADTIIRLYESNYPSDKIQVLVGSDNSTDNTNAIVEELMKKYSSLKLFPFTERSGKAAILNRLAPKTDSEIIHFCDANTLYYKDALRLMVSYFADIRVGGVGGRLKLLDSRQSIETGSQETTYWNIETQIKLHEGSMGVLIGAWGPIFSIRRELFVPVPLNPSATDDLFICLKVIEQRKDFIYEQNAVAEEFTAPSPEAEFARKMRFGMTNMATIPHIKKLLNPFRGLAAYCLWSHKIFRWLSPIVLALILLSNLFLMNCRIFSGIFYYTFLFQSAFYTAAILGFLSSKLKIRFKPFLLVYYFVLTNVALLSGLFKHLTLKKVSVWKPTER